MRCLEERLKFRFGSASDRLRFDSASVRLKREGESVTLPPSLCYVRRRLEIRSRKFFPLRLPDFNCVPYGRRAVGEPAARFCRLSDAGRTLR